MFWSGFFFFFFKRRIGSSHRIGDWPEIRILFFGFNIYKVQYHVIFWFIIFNLDYKIDKFQIKKTKRRGLAHLYLLMNSHQYGFKRAHIHIRAHAYWTLSFPLSHYHSPETLKAGTVGRPLTSTTTFQTYKQKKKVKNPNQTKAPLTPFVEYIRIQYKSPFISSLFFLFFFFLFSLYK